MTDDALAVARRWLAAEPDDDIRAELHALIGGPPDDLASRFGGRLHFGTAGLRAEVGAGPMRMNRLVVRQAAAGLARHLRQIDPTASARGVLIGFDARRKSDVFALDTARVLACAAGVVVTASHNPPADNGYKVYLGDGAQIVPPHDVAISGHIDRIDPTTVPVADLDDPLIDRLDASLVDRYVASVPAVRLRADLHDVVVAYTPMHGVGGEVLLRAFDAAGLPAPAVVDAQFAPDATFPTVAFPNPEEPGAMDLLLALAASSGAHVAIANDPDADRLGAAIPQPDGAWRRLTGDELGWLLADHILTHTAGDDRLVITTLVSSSLLGRMAADHNVHFAETFTGFKWIGRTILDHPDQRFVFGYEQALGYLVAPRPLDKDGITAAVLMAEVAALAVAEGTTLQARLDDLAARYGRHVTADHSVRMDPAAGAARVAELQADPPSSIGGLAVDDVVWFAGAGLLRFELAGGVRVQVRPSGTEPKVKIYGEAIDSDPSPLIAALAALLG
jgi:phosphomannomutase